MRRAHLLGRGSARILGNIGDNLIVLALNFLWIDDDLGREFLLKGFLELSDEDAVPEFRTCAFNAERMLRQQLIERCRSVRTTLGSRHDFVGTRLHIIIRNDDPLLGGLALQKRRQDELLLDLLRELLGHPLLAVLQFLGRNLRQLFGRNLRHPRLDDLRNVRVNVGLHEFDVTNRHDHNV